jgi:hypothetical protein
LHGSAAFYRAVGGLFGGAGVLGGDASGFTNDRGRAVADESQGCYSDHQKSMDEYDSKEFQILYM